MVAHSDLVADCSRSASLVTAGVVWKQALYEGTEGEED